MTTLRRPLVVGALATGLLVTAVPAHAAPLVPSGPIRSTFSLSAPAPFAPCPTVGEITELTVTRTDTEFREPDGTLVRAVAHVSFTGTLTGWSGQTVSYSGHFTVTDDHAAGVSVTTGLNGRATLPDGDVVLAAGRRVTDLDTGALEAVAGNNTFGGFTEEICDALAD